MIFLGSHARGSGSGEHASRPLGARHAVCGTRSLVATIAQAALLVTRLLLHPSPWAPPQLLGAGAGRNPDLLHNC